MIISELCSSNGIINCWIGLHKEPNHNDNNNWYWIQNNITTNFTKWNLISKNENCAEITARSYNMDRNRVYKGEWNEIPCNSLKYPICNDPLISNYFHHELYQYPLKHNRKLLQKQNISTISCNWTYSDDDICIIYASDIIQQIECNPAYQNCEINIDIGANYAGAASTIYCPQKDCLSCIINCYGACPGMNIKNNNCTVVSVFCNATLSQSNDNPAIIRDSTIHAPSNGGSLEILIGNGCQMHSTNIISSPGTANVIMDINGRYNEENVIDGLYITGYLNYSCRGTALCGRSRIICGPSNTYCNINCSSSSPRYGSCENMIVYAEGGTTDVNWYCDNVQPMTCLDAELECGNISDPLYSEWQYDTLNGWYYRTEDCVENWKAPLVTCTINSDDTCSIIRQYMDSSRSIQCTDDLPNCLVQLGDVDAENGWSNDLNSIIHCPSSECDSCIIQCISEYACFNITIYGYNCCLLQVNIRARYQGYATIYAPGNGGDLVLLTNAEQSHTGFEYGKIYSSPGTKNIVIYLDNFGRSNLINGTYVINDLNVTCGINGVCGHNDIICPNAGTCNIDCSKATELGCMLMDVIAIQGINNLNWKCNDEDPKWNCYNGYLHSNDYSVWWSCYMEYNYINSQWELRDCIDIPIKERPAPTIPPTTSQCVAPTAAIQEGFLNETEFGVIITGSALLFILIVVGLIYYYKIYKPEKKSLYIRNGMVVLIGIGEYNEEVLTSEIDGYLRELDGIDHDIENMVKLFHDELNYDIYPSEYLDVIKNGWSPKQHWRENELKDYLEDRAKYLEEHIEEYDGLIVVISCHGIAGNICTSDYKKFSKLAIHRIFSSSHPKTRRIPRVFLFDCCSGSNEQELDRDSSTSMNDEDGKSIKHNDLSKQVVLNDVDGDGDIAKPWIRGEHNPDYRLAVIEAANPGFQSKLRTDTGSYVVHSFYEKTMDILTKNKMKYLYNIFDEIQDELHNLGKQHPTYIWNEDTRYIRFKKRDNASIKQIEMEELEETKTQ